MKKSYDTVVPPPPKKAQEEKEFEKLRAGTLLGVLTQIVFHGQQEDKMKNGDIKNRDKISFVFAFPKETFSYVKNEGKENEETITGRMSHSCTHTYSFYKSAHLLGLLEGMIERSLTSHEETNGFDWSNILGKGFAVQVAHNKSADGNKTYVNIKNVMPLMEDTPVPEIDETPFVFSFAHLGLKSKWEFYELDNYGKIHGLVRWIIENKSLDFLELDNEPKPVNGTPVDLDAKVEIPQDVSEAVKAESQAESENQTEGEDDDLPF